MIRRLSQATEVARPYESSAAVTDAGTVQSTLADAAAFSDGYRDGYQAGEADALRDGQAKFAKLEAELRDRQEAIEAAWRADSERLTAFAQSVAKQEAARVAEIDASAFEVALLALTAAFEEHAEDRTWVHRAITKVAKDFHADALVLQVAEGDRALLPDDVDGLKIELKPGLAQGSCVLVTRRGQVENSIAERLEIIHRCMLAALGESAGDK